MKKYLKGIGMLVGLIFGAGLFALPYSFSRAGLFWGTVHFVVTFLVLVFLHFLYSEVAYFTKGTHRFTGYVEIFLGKKAKTVALLISIVTYYGALLVYGILGGNFLFNIFGVYSEQTFSILFFCVAGVLVLLNLKKIGSINFYLTIPLFAFVIYLFIAAFPFIDVSNFAINNSIVSKDWFLPYGIWLFALTGFAVIPEIRDIFEGTSVKKMRRVVVISLALSAFFYLLFVAAVWGVGGLGTTKDSFSGLAGVLGGKALVVGSLIGLLAVFTSFLSLAVDLKNIFAYDYKISRPLAWAMSVTPPFLLFFTGTTDYIKIVGFVGALGLGFTGIFIVRMSHGLSEKIAKKETKKIIEPQEGERMKHYHSFEMFVLVAIIAGVAYELWNTIL